MNTKMVGKKRRYSEKNYKSPVLMDKKDYMMTRFMNGKL